MVRLPHAAPGHGGLAARGHGSMAAVRYKCMAGGAPRGVPLSPFVGALAAPTAASGSTAANTQPLLGCVVWDAVPEMLPQGREPNKCTGCVGAPLPRVGGAMSCNTSTGLLDLGCCAWSGDVEGAARREPAVLRCSAFWALHSRRDGANQCDDMLLPHDPACLVP